MASAPKVKDASVAVERAEVAAASEMQLITASESALSMKVEQLGR